MATIVGGQSAIPNLETIATDALSLYQKLLPNEYFEGLRRYGPLCENNRVYNAAVVMWLMIDQRLHGGSMSESVLELICGLPSTFWPRPCRRLLALAQDKRRRLSANTGSYNDARQDLPLAVMEGSFDRATDGMLGAAVGPGGEASRVFFVDGTSMRGPHNEEMCQAYPPVTNQHGESHWPVLRVLVAHDLHTGLAMRPQWGPMYGAQAVSEQGLFAGLLGRLPKGSTVLADINFGVFSVAYAADQQNHPTLLRLLGARAKRLLGGKPLRDGIDQRVQWRPSSADRKGNPQLPVDASVVGRVIVRQVQPSNGGQPLLLALFSTREEPAEELVGLYGERWKIEVDLRTLKSTLQLEELTCTSPTMVAKEIVMGMLAYNLVRAVMFVAAQAAGVAPRAFSFTQVRNVVNAFGPRIAAAKTTEEAQRLNEDMLYYASRALLPRRHRPRNSYPRAVWKRRQSFPGRRK